jgi:hypothetical protein
MGKRNSIKDKLDITYYNYSKKGYFKYNYCSKKE